MTWRTPYRIQNRFPVGFPAGHTRLPLDEVDETTKAFLENLISQYEIDLPV